MSEGSVGSFGDGLADRSLVPDVLGFEAEVNPLPASFYFSKMYTVRTKLYTSAIFAGPSSGNGTESLFSQIN